MQLFKQKLQHLITYFLKLMLKFNHHDVLYDYQMDKCEIQKYDMQHFERVELSNNHW